MVHGKCRLGTTVLHYSHLSAPTSVTDNGSLNDVYTSITEQVSEASKAINAEIEALYDIYRKGMDENKDNATELYGIQGIPQIMLFAPNGTILKRNLRGEEMKAFVSAKMAK